MRREHVVVFCLALCSLLQAQTTSSDDLVTVSSASARPAVAPESLATLYGENLAPLTIAAQLDSAGQYPAKLGGVTVQFAGRTARLLYISPKQINCLVPRDAPIGNVEVIVRSDDNGRVVRGSVIVGRLSPGLFLLDADGTAAVVNAVTFSLGPFPAVTPENLGSDKATRLSLFGTGFRASATAPAVTAHDGSGRSFDLPVEYSGEAPSLIGVDQINVRLPGEMSGVGDVVANAAFGAEHSNSVGFQMQASPEPEPPATGDACNPLRQVESRLILEAAAACMDIPLGSNCTDFSLLTRHGIDLPGDFPAVVPGFGAPLGAFHIRKFLDGKRALLYYSSNSRPQGAPNLDVPALVRSTTPYKAMHADLQARLMARVREIQAAGMPVTPAALAEFLNGLTEPPRLCAQPGPSCDQGFLISREEPNLFWAVYRVRQVVLQKVQPGEINLSPTRVAVSIVYSLLDPYDFNEGDRDQNSAAARMAAEAALYLQNTCRSAGTYRIRIDVEDELVVPISMLGTWVGTYIWDCKGGGEIVHKGSRSLTIQITGEDVGSQFPRLNGMLELGPFPIDPRVGSGSVGAVTTSFLGAFYPPGFVMNGSEIYTGSSSLLVSDGSIALLTSPDTLRPSIDLMGRLQGDSITGWGLNGYFVNGKTDGGCSARMPPTATFSVSRR